MKTEQPTVTTLQEKKKKGGWFPILLALVILLASGAGGLYWTGILKPEKLMPAEAEKPAQVTQRPEGVKLSGNAKLGSLQLDESAAAEDTVELGGGKDGGIQKLPKPGDTEKPVLPKGYGLTESKAGKEGTAEEPASTPTPAPTPKENRPGQTAGTEEGGVDLQPPVEPKTKVDNGNTVEKIDPRKVGVTTNDGPEKEYEETALTVQRTLTAVMGDDRQMIRLRVPVMYKSRTLRLEGESLAEAKRIHGELKAKAAALATLKADLERLLGDWNGLVKRTTPSEALLPESPTLPENQSAGNLNRKGNPDLEPGKAISYEIVTPQSK